MADDTYSEFINNITNVASEIGSKNFELDFSTNFLTSCPSLKNKKYVDNVLSEAK